MEAYQGRSERVEIVKASGYGIHVQVRMWCKDYVERRTKVTTENSGADDGCMWSNTER